MDWFIFAVGMVIGIIVFEFVKRFVLKRTAHIVIFLIVLFVVFLIFSALFADTAQFKESKAVQTGAAIAGVFSKGTEDVKKEGITKSSGLFNSTFKKE